VDPLPDCVKPHTTPATCSVLQLSRLPLRAKPGMAPEQLNYSYQIPLHFLPTAVAATEESGL
jgi:hypothetical protein